MRRLLISRRLKLFLFIAVSLKVLVAPAGAQEDITADLARAEALYYGAEFEPAITLLHDLERRIGNDPQRAADRLRIRLYLGLAHLGLNQTENARSRFVEVCQLDRKYTLSAADYSPKVITLFDEAKEMCAQSYCADVCSQIGAAVAEGKISVAQEQIEAAGQCPCAAASTGLIANARYKRAMELYGQGLFPEAVKELNSVLALDSTHELAREYLKLSQQRMELTTQQAFADWRMNFDARQYDKAAAAYQKVRSSNVESLARQLTGQLESEYAKALSGLVTNWKVACAAGDPLRMDTIRKEAEALGAGLPFSRAPLAEMGQCVAQGCVRGDPVLAMNRLKSRVNPQIEPALQRYVSRGIRVSIEIDLEGNVTVKQITNANIRLAEALRIAVAQWKFYPAVINNLSRCVETELPITLIQPQEQD